MKTQKTLTLGIFVEVLYPWRGAVQSDPFCHGRKVSRLIKKYYIFQTKNTEETPMAMIISNLM